MIRDAAFHIVDERNFINATRDAGYRCTASAVSELIDNALQAGADVIKVSVRQEGSGPGRQVTLLVADNGSGMDRRTLRTALRFGGSSRFNSRSGLGRYGMGLPNSSLSQARRVNVYTWQKSGGIIHSYLDVDEITAGRMPRVPTPRGSKLPSGVGDRRWRSGTIVEWVRCDRLDHRKASTIVSHLHANLGRCFRHFLWRGIRLFINDEMVQPIDPLFVQPLSGVKEHASVFNRPLEFEVRLPADSTRTSVVTVTFSELPVAAWTRLPIEEKARMGISKNAGLSVVRSDREIDYGWYLFGNKRRENYDDWWRAELRFEPELDECFGVTHSKQGVTPSDYIRQILSPELEAFAHTLNARVRAAFNALRSRDAGNGRAAERAAARDVLLPPTNPNRSEHEDVVANAELPRYELRVEPLGCPEFYLAEMGKAGLIRLVINSNHPFYSQVYAPLRRPDREQERIRIECVLLAAARTDLEVQGDRRKSWLNRHRSEWSNAIAAFLGDD